MKPTFLNQISLGHILTAFPVLMAIGAWALHTEVRLTTAETTMSHISADIESSDKRAIEATADIRQSLRDIQSKLDAALIRMIGRDHAELEVKP